MKYLITDNFIQHMLAKSAIKLFSVHHFYITTLGGDNASFKLFLRHTNTSNTYQVGEHGIELS